MIVSTAWWYSRCLTGGVEISEPSERLVGPVRVVGFVELVELLKRAFSRGSETGMSVEQSVEVRLVGFAEMVGPPQEGEAGSQAGPARTLGAAAAGSRCCISRRTRVRPWVNQRATWKRSSTWRASGRYCAMVWVVWAGPVGDDCLHLAAPPGSLIPEEPGQRRFRATRDHRQHLAAVTGGDHGHIPMPAPNRGFVDQQHTRGPGPATLRHLSRLRADQAHDPMPTHPMMAGHCPNRHHRRILNH